MAKKKESLLSDTPKKSRNPWKIGFLSLIVILIIIVIVSVVLIDQIKDMLCPVNTEGNKGTELIPLRPSIEQVEGGVEEEEEEEELERHGCWSDAVEQFDVTRQQLIGIFDDGTGCLSEAFNQEDPDTGENYDWGEEWPWGEDISPEMKEVIKDACSDIVNPDVIDAINWGHIHCRRGPDNSLHDLGGPDW